MARSSATGAGGVASKAPAGIAPVVAERSFLASSLLVFCVANSGALFGFLFQWVAVRHLSKPDYGAMGALLTLVTYLVIPGQAVQLVFSRHTAKRVARGEHSRLRSLVRQTLRLVTALAALYGAVFLAVGPWLRSAYHLDGVTPVWLAVAVAVASLYWFFALGGLQGFQEFGRFGIYQAGPSWLKFLCAGGLAVLGFGLGGVLVGSALAFAVLLVPMGRRLSHSIGDAAPAPSGLADRQLLAEWSPLLLTFGGFTILTNIDITFVRYYFGDHPEGLDGNYYAAAVLAKTVFYFPLAIVNVTFSKVASAAARGQSHLHLLGKNLALTVVLSGVGIAVLATVPEWILGVYDVRYVGAAPLLRAYLAPATLFGLVAVFMHYYFALGRRSYALVILAAAGTAVLGFDRFHDAPGDLIAVLTAVGAGLLVVSGALIPVYLRRR